MRKRVLYVQRPGGGGSATALLNMVAALDRTRFEPVVQFHEEGPACETLRAGGIEVLVLDESGSGSRRGWPGRVASLPGLRRVGGAASAVHRMVRAELPLARRLAERISELRVDLVHQNNNPGGNRASIVAARLANVPQVCHVRFLKDYTPIVDRAVVSLADFFLYVSRAVERDFRDRFGVSPHRGATIHDPVPPERFDAFPDGARLRAELGLPTECRLLVHVGRLVSWKGQDLFLRAAARVMDDHPDVRALVVGSPDEGAGSRAYGRGLRELVRRLGVADRVRFAGFRSDIPEVLAAADVVVHSSTRPEPYGLVVVEAMAAGRPVVAAAAGGVLETMRHDVTGLLVPPGDVAALAAAVGRLLSEPEVARRLGERARRDARSRFSPRASAATLEAVYERVLGVVPAPAMAPGMAAARAPVPGWPAVAGDTT